MEKIKEILLRYVMGVIIAILTLAVPVFYFIFRPLTVWPTAVILKAFYNVTFNMTSITINNFRIEIIDACIAGSAYLLLLILNILTFGISLKKRIFIFIFDSAILLILNIIRLITLTIMLVNQTTAFDVTHKLFWYGLSTIFVVAIWILTIAIFKIKAIPFWSDVKFILSRVKKQNL